MPISSVWGAAVVLQDAAEREVAFPRPELVHLALRGDADDARPRPAPVGQRLPGQDAARRLRRLVRGERVEGVAERQSFSQLMRT